MAASLLTNSEIGVLCASALALGFVLGRSFIAKRSSMGSSKNAGPQEIPSTKLQGRLLQLLDGSTIAIDPREAAEVLDSTLETALENPTRKFVLRFEIWPAATDKWLVSAHGPESKAESRQSNL